MTIDEGRKPEGPPERSPKAGEGAPSGAVEHANSEVVGIHAARSANRFEALEPVRQGVHRYLGAIAPDVARGLKLRHDHGSNYMFGDLQDESNAWASKLRPPLCVNPRATASPNASYEP